MSVRPASKEHAFKVWMEQGKPSGRELGRILAEQGFTTHHASLNRWMRSDPKWVEAIEMARKAKPERIITALVAAKEDATSLTPDHFMGVKAQLVARLYDTIKAMPIGSVDEWMKALDCCERIEGLIHAERGKVVGEKAAAASIASASIMDKLNPTVNVAPFRKANGNGAA